MVFFRLRVLYVGACTCASLGCVARHDLQQRRARDSPLTRPKFMARDYALLDITGHGAYRCGQDLGYLFGVIKFVRVDTCGADQRYVDHSLCRDLICVLCCRHSLPSFLRVVIDKPRQGPMPLHAQELTTRIKGTVKTATS